MKSPKIAIIGGGASGYFAAINAAENNPEASVTLLEGTQRTLTKVKISGGGRCNVTHHCFEPEKLVGNYPRGYRELRGPFSRFQPRDTVAWFAAHGVTLTAADTIVWWGPTYSVEIYEQANARVHRQGQVNKCTVIQLQGSAAEKRVYAALDKKIDSHLRIVDLYNEVLES